MWEDLDSEEPLFLENNKPRLIDLQLWTWDPKKKHTTLSPPKMGREVSRKNPRKMHSWQTCTWRMAPHLVNTKWLVSLDEPYLGDLLTVVNGMILKHGSVKYPIPPKRHPTIFLRSFRIWSTKITFKNTSLGSLLVSRAFSTTCGVPKDWPVKMVETPCWVPMVAYQKSML